jgi:hypothetical protein
MSSTNAGKYLIVFLGVMLSGCVMMSSPEVDFKGVVVSKSEPASGCSPKGNLVAIADAAIKTVGDQPLSLNRKATQELIDKAVVLQANYVHIVDHRQYSSSPQKGLVFRVAMKAKSFYCQALDIERVD